MTFEEFQQCVQRFVATGKRVFATSSFQSHSLPMLHMISRVDRTIPVAFLDTGYLFPETLEFRDRVTALLDLNLHIVRPSVPKIHQRDIEGRLYFTSDTERCCFLNKVQPLEPWLQNYDVWINGIRGDQNDHRKRMQTEMQGPHGCRRLHPMLDWTRRQIHEYCREHSLPSHPLESTGYLSIGCEPCTVKLDLRSDDPRTARWLGQQKTECGLHIDLVQSEGHQE